MTREPSVLTSGVGDRVPDAPIPLTVPILLPASFGVATLVLSLQMLPEPTCNIRVTILGLG